MQSTHNLIWLLFSQSFYENMLKEKKIKNGFALFCIYKFVNKPQLIKFYDREHCLSRFRQLIIFTLIVDPQLNKVQKKYSQTIEMNCTPRKQNSERFIKELLLFKERFQN